MKRAIFCVVLTCTVLRSFGQGTIVLNNRIPGVVVTHVWFGCPKIQGNSPTDYPPGTTSYDGFVLTGAAGGPSASTTWATLLGAPGSNMPEYTLLPSASAPTSFRTGAGAGTVVPTTVAFPAIPAGVSVGTFQMVVWDNSSGLYPTWTEASAAWLNGLIPAGKSSTFVLTNLGSGATYLTGLQSFSWGYMECPPHIFQQPTNQAAVVGGQAAFSISAGTWTGFTNYQWYFNNSPLVGATNSLLPLSNLQLSNFGSYFVVVDETINSLPWDSVTSSVANLTIAASPSLTNFSAGSNAKISFRTEAGPNYVVEYKSDLTDSAWVPLSTNAGTAGTVEITDPTAVIASRFYRVRLY